MDFYLVVALFFMTTTQTPLDTKIGPQNPIITILADVRVDMVKAEE